MKYTVVQVLQDILNEAHSTGSNCIAIKPKTVYKLTGDQRPFKKSKFDYINELLRDAGYEYHRSGDSVIISI